MMTDKPAPAKDEGTGRFLTGNIGGGRKPGARNKLGEAFIQALHDSFEEHGEATIETVRTEKPDQYLKVIAALIPSEHRITVTDQFAEMTDDELAARARQLARDLAPLLGGVGGDQAGDAGEVGAAIAPRIH